jgi:hypothetical protein
MLVVMASIVPHEVYGKPVICPSAAWHPALTILHFIFGLMDFPRQLINPSPSRILRLRIWEHQEIMICRFPHTILHRGAS